MGLELFTHLLPNARAWRLTTQKRLRQFFEGLSGTADDVRGFVDEVHGDLFPATTRELEEWEQQYGIRRGTVDTATRRARLASAWSAQGGQSPSYLQSALRAAGFDVYVYEWFVPGSNPAQARDPRTVGGYALADKGTYLAEDIAPAGHPEMECGEPRAQCGNLFSFGFIERPMPVSGDPAKWPYYLYIGGSIFGSTAEVPVERRDEFEALALKLRPAQQWLIFIVEYT